MKERLWFETAGDPRCDMDIQQLNFHHLFYFWRVAKIGHLTDTAKQLHLSQSALSAQIKQLEERLGTPLFERQGRSLILTASGQMAFSYAERLFGLGQEMLGRLQGHKDGQLQIRVGSVATMSRNYQENLLRPLLEDERVTLILESGLLAGLLDRLVTHQLDLVLANEPVATGPERPLICRFMGKQSISVVGPAQRWQGTRLKVPEDLDGLEIAVPGLHHDLRMQFEALCIAADVKPRIRAQVDDMAMLRLIARDSGWLTVLPEVVVQDELRLGTLVVVGQTDALQENFYAITTPQRDRIEPLDRLLTQTQPLAGTAASASVDPSGH